MSPQEKQFPISFTMSRYGLPQFRPRMCLEPYGQRQWQALKFLDMGGGVETSVLCYPIGFALYENEMAVFLMVKGGLLADNVPAQSPVITCAY